MCLSVSYSQNPSDKVYVDNGILKWTDTKADVALFGVNYSTPFAHAYRSIEKLGLSHEEAIDMDVSQMARLELEAYRIHVWDREVSDSLGNLIANRHLELLDYLIFKLKEKNIHVLLTPIAWWGTGWPEPDPQTTGFSSFNSKTELITNPAARKAQQNYLKQFLNHKNKYTGLSYKEDPDIIAFEIINEPGHPSDTAMVTAYINEMAAVIRSQGVTKPVYYNISQNWSEEQAAAVYRAEIDGISFQWYPSGLVKNSALTGNYLAHVDHYPIPEINDPKFKNKTRMVYEFDAADIAQSIMYPAMARSFREAGMQWATMFSYDPSFLAAYNTEYNTHYLNLLYTPQKALGLMIAANVFRTVDTYQKFPSYPGNTSFDGFRILYDNNLAELNNGEKFYYTNSTSSKPLDKDALQHIAGYGSSVLVQTDATGAYFIDKIDDDVWRLELYPDVVKLTDPFGRNSLDRKVRILQDNISSITLCIPGLDADFIAHALVKERDDTIIAKEGLISIKPGVYILSNTAIENINDIKFDYRRIALDEFPVVLPEKIYPQVKNLGQDKIFENESWKPSFQIISDSAPDSVRLYIRQPGWRGFRSVVMEALGKNIYGTEITDDIRNGQLQYCISVSSAAGEISYPALLNKNPNSWDYFADATWELDILPEEVSLLLFDPASDTDNCIFGSYWGRFRVRSSVLWDKQHKGWYNLELSDFRQQSKEFTLQIELDNKGNNENLNDYKFIEFDISNQSTVEKFKFQVVNAQYGVLEKDIKLENDDKRIRIPLTGYKPKEIVLLPRPYPHFLPYSFKAQSLDKTDTTKDISFIQITIPFEKKMEEKDQLRLQISAISLVK